MNLNNKAFTLTELMIVVAIVGIIAAFAVPSFTRSIQKSHQRDMVLQLTTLHAANVMSRARDGGFWNTGGGNQGMAAINTNLGINIIANDSTYVYSSADGSAFTATATWTTYTIKVTNGAIDTDGVSPDNPCCSTMNCRTVIDC